MVLLDTNLHFNGENNVWISHILCVKLRSWNPTTWIWVNKGTPDTNMLPVRCLFTSWRALFFTPKCMTRLKIFSHSFKNAFFGTGVQIFFYIFLSISFDFQSPFLVKSHPLTVKGPGGSLISSRKMAIRHKSKVWYLNFFY